MDIDPAFKTVWRPAEVVGPGEAWFDALRTPFIGFADRTLVSFAHP